MKPVLCYIFSAQEGYCLTSCSFVYFKMDVAVELIDG